MKFFYINNENCTCCELCINSCPTAAIYINENKRVINYDLCRSCGNCYRDCNSRAITIENLDKVTSQMEIIEQYRERIIHLEKENRSLKRGYDKAMLSASAVMDRIPIAMFICDKNNQIIFINPRLIEIFNIPMYKQERVKEGITPSELLPEQICNAFRTVNANEDKTNEIIRCENAAFSLSVFRLRDQDVTLCTIRNLNSKTELREVISEQLRQTIDRKMAMVQKIGFLLGEEVSEVVGNLNSIIDIIDGADGK